MSWELSKGANKYYDRLDKRLQDRFIDALNEFPEGDIKRLKGKTGHYRIRVGDYRLLFQYVNKKDIYVYEISPWGDA